MAYKQNKKNIKEKMHYYYYKHKTDVSIFLIYVMKPFRDLKTFRKSHLLNMTEGVETLSISYEFERTINP